MSGKSGKSLAERLGFGVNAQSLDELRTYLQSVSDLVFPPGEPPDTLPGYCHVCQSELQFLVEQAEGQVNWRETLRCPSCQLINRWRSAVQIFEVLCQPQPDCRIYITEAVTSLYLAFLQRYPNTVGSEYVSGHRSGEQVTAYGRGVLIQDVTALSFENNHFDAVLSFDVLEHVPDYLSALREFWRVLKPGCWLIMSAPFSFAEATEIRATLQPDGSIVHLLPPDYHGDPLSDQGVLCFQSFGMDLLDRMRDLGFEETTVFGFADRKLGYLGGNILFLGRKPGRAGSIMQRPGRWFANWGRKSKLPQT